MQPCPTTVLTNLDLTLKNPAEAGFFYSCAIALTGQIDAHVPQEIHLLVSITHLPSAPTDIAPTGHMPIQL